CQKPETRRSSWLSRRRTRGPRGRPIAEWMEEAGIERAILRADDFTEARPRLPDAAGPYRFRRPCAPPRKRSRGEERGVETRGRGEERCGDAGRRDAGTRRGGKGGVGEGAKERRGEGPIAARR